MHVKGAEHPFVILSKMVNFVCLVQLSSLKQEGFFLMNSEEFFEYSFGFFMFFLSYADSIGICRRLIYPELSGSQPQQICFLIPGHYLHIFNNT